MALIGMPPVLTARLPGGVDEHHAQPVLGGDDRGAQARGPGADDRDIGRRDIGRRDIVRRPGRSALVSHARPPGTPYRTARA